MLAVKDEMKSYVGKRKHWSQMTTDEVVGIFNRLKSVQNDEWEMIDHALDRLHEKKIQATKEDIVSTIYNANVVEYKIDSSRGKCDERVVLRAKAIVNRDYNLNAVYSLTNKRIITVWINHIKDRHATLDWNIYDKNMKVFGI